ncbi:MAG: hypothetical protein NC299_18450 [Lachnospiraceae bacterium]|nr:hypothetical protein [Ruminococcus sp.]MCM1277309.1 hypothetical protein [Lachnospiraceae bacterium]
MNTSIYLVLKYWSKHKKNLAAVIFSGVLLAAFIMAFLLSKRETCARELDRYYDGYGAYDIIIGNSDDEILAKVTEGKSNYKYGYIEVLGEVGTPAKRYLYGVLHDPQNMYHAPLREGRLPQTSSEIALDEDIVKELYWVGKCGETITLDGVTYTVTGIMGRDTNYYRKGLHWGTEFSEYNLPPIFIGDSNKTPLYRIDMLGNYYNGELLPGMDERSKSLDGRLAYEQLLNEMIEDDEHWVYPNYDVNQTLKDNVKNDVHDNSNFLLFIMTVGIVIAGLSVFSVTKSVFAERAEWMSMLRRIGAGRGVIARFYAAECMFTLLLQTMLGYIAGIAAYYGIFAYKVNALGAKPISGFSFHYAVTNNSRNPFLYTAIFSVAVILPAYLLCALTSKQRARKLKPAKKPRRLNRCLGKTFASGGVTVVQIISLTLICFSVVNSYLYFTRDGKTPKDFLSMPQEIEDYSAGNIDMKEEGIAEYYFCTAPIPTGIGHRDNDIGQSFIAINPDDTKGFGDDTAAKLPEGTVSTGSMDYLFIASDEPVRACGSEIDLSNDAVRDLFLQTSAEKYQNFFDEGQLGSKHLYQAPTRLADANTISGLSEYVIEGEINLDAINSGKEVIIAYAQSSPPFVKGDTVTLYMTEANADGYGAGNITGAEVVVGAVVKIQENVPAVVRNAVCDSERKFNFLTTSTGAAAMGAPSCSYSEAYSYEEVTGAPFPLSAEVSVKSLKEIKHGIFINRMTKIGIVALILSAMLLLGFSAYFNGIGIKIRAKKYEASVLRAVGAPVSVIRKRLMFGSLKIPIIASALSYVFLRAEQFVMEKLGTWYIEQRWAHQDMNHAVHESISGLHLSQVEQAEYFKDVNAHLVHINHVRRTFFLDNGMWELKAEIPCLIFLVILCASTFILTALALKKFKRDIANDLNSGRTRQ